MRDTRTSSATGRFHAFVASFLGWTLDNFDYCVVLFLVDTLASAFGVTRGAIILTLTATLAMRPVGAIIFGLLADRYGRRIPLMANVILFSVIEMCCGFSPNYTFFFIMRALYGVGLGGEWGVGASLAMEAAPKRWRGLFSGLLQSGFSTGYLLAAILARFALPTLGWRWMFWLGGIPALLALYIRSRVPESEAWKQHRAPTTAAILRILRAEWKKVAYLVLLMVFMMLLSHGSQDLYPDFLVNAHGLSASTASDVAILYNIGAIIGAITCAAISEGRGRRIAMVGALVVAFVSIPWWAFGHSILALALGSIFMQAGVMGSWGVLPAHLNEMSHDATRGLVPGLAYQLGILIASPTNSIEFGLRDRFGYQWALAGFEIVTILLLTITISLGTERRGRTFLEPVDRSLDSVRPVERAMC